MINLFFSRQFLLFLFVGSVSAALNIFSRIILNLWLPYFESIILAYCMATSLAFTLNYFFVFPGSIKSTASQFTGFILTNLFFLPIVLLSSILLNGWFLRLGFIPFTQLSAHIFAVSLPLFFSFLIYKFSTFK